MYNENNQINVYIEDKKKNNKFVDGLLDWAESFVFAVFVVILIFTFVLRTVVVVGDSMNPNFTDKDRLIITHIALSPKKGDVLVLNSEGLDETIIKRCIGTEGDTVRIDYNTNTVTVNGDEIENDYINEVMEDRQPAFDQNYAVGEHIYEYKVPDGKVFVMGDNRNHSSDSRSERVGFIDESDVLGKVVFRIYPFDSIGKISNRL